MPRTYDDWKLATPPEYSDDEDARYESDAYGDDDYDTFCPVCGGEVESLGQLGTRCYSRCVNCHAEFGRGRL